VAVVGVISSVFRAPSRSTTTVTCSPADSWKTWETRVIVGSCSPFTESTTSPDSMPACFAGDTASPGEHSVVRLFGRTQPTLDVKVVVGAPNPHSSTPNSTMPITRFIAGPATITMIRFHGVRR
jgi:hypothetical protein